MVWARPDLRPLKRRALAAAKRSAWLRAAFPTLLQPSFDAFVVSYPKCGRTWLRVMFGKALCDGYGLPASSLMRPIELTRAAGLRVTQFTHDDGIFFRPRWYRPDPEKRRYQGKHVLLLTRGLPATLVSSYHHVSKRDRLFDGTLAEFVRSPRFGAAQLIRFYEQWHAARARPASFTVVRYEDMLRDPRVGLDAALRLVGSRALGDDVVAAALAYGSLENMRQLEAADALGDKRMRPRDRHDPDSYKVRQGGAGRREGLSPDDEAYVAELVAASGCPLLQPPSALP